MASKVVEPDLLAEMAPNASEQVLRPPAAELVALAVAEAAGNQPEQPKGQVPVQQVVNAPNDGEAPLTLQLCGIVFHIFSPCF